MVYNVISLRLTHPFFSWANGLYAIIETIGTELRMCQISREGKPFLFDDGSFMITCTGINNKEVYPTNLKFEWK